jgi:hypothetical protein
MIQLLHDTLNATAGWKRSSSRKAGVLIAGVPTPDDAVRRGVVSPQELRGQGGYPRADSNISIEIFLIH